MKRQSYLEASARQRLHSLVDADSFVEVCPPSEHLTSPHLALLELPVAFDDGVVIGEGKLNGDAVLLIAQEGRFNGGAVGEIHGAKIVGLLKRALQTRPAAVLLLVDSGGVRLHEANAGLIAISEIMRAVLAVRAAGVPVFAFVGGSCGAFGGMGIVTRLCDRVVMSEEGRLSLSGPEVIETVKGVEEFDSRDRPLVWRVTGGKLRCALGEASQLVEDDMAAFRAAACQLIAEAKSQSFTSVDDLASLEATQSALQQRHAQFASARDGAEVWAARQLHAPRGVAMLSAAEFNAQLASLNEVAA